MRQVTPDSMLLQYLNSSILKASFVLKASPLLSRAPACENTSVGYPVSGDTSTPALSAHMTREPVILAAWKCSRSEDKAWL